MMSPHPFHFLLKSTFFSAFKGKGTDERVRKKIICQPKENPGTGECRSTCCIFYFAAIAKDFISAGVCSENPLISNESHSTPEPAIRGKLARIKLQPLGSTSWKSPKPPNTHPFLDDDGKCQWDGLGQVAQVLGI